MRNALVTGGGRGIGWAVVRELLAHGYHVWVNVRKENDTLTEAIRASGGLLQSLVFDMQNTAQMTEALKPLQNQSLDLLVNNAGTLKDNLLPSIEMHDWEHIIDVNFTCLVKLHQLAEPMLKRSSHAVVVSMGSISGVRPRAGQGPYAVSKAMIIEWTRSMADPRKGISYYTVSPGPVATDMIKKAPWYTQPDAFSRIPMKRFAEPEEIARCILMLDRSRDIIATGSNIVIDGGFVQTTRGS